MTSSPFGVPGTVPEPGPVQTVDPVGAPPAQGRNKAIAFGVAGAIILAAAAGAGAFFLLSPEDDEAPVAAPPTADKPAEQAEEVMGQAPVLTSFNSRNPWIQLDDTSAGSSVAAPAAPSAGGAAGASGTSLYSGTSSTGGTGSGTSTVRLTTGTNAAGPASQGEKGEKGDPGDKGEAGAAGPAGEQGPPGVSLGVVSVKVTNPQLATVTTPDAATFEVVTFGPGAQGQLNDGKPYTVEAGNTLRWSLVPPGDPLAGQVTFKELTDTNGNGVWDAGDIVQFTVNGTPYNIPATGASIEYTFFVSATA